MSFTPVVSAKAGSSGAKKISIKPLKIKPKIPENFEAETWAKLRAAVRAVHAKQAVGHSFEELYRAVEDMCLQNLAGTVYDRLRAECEQHIESRLELLLGQTPDVLAFLTLVQACWADHCEQMLTLRSIFLYLDRTYVMQAATKKSLWDMGLQIFRTHLSRRPEVARKAVQGLLQLIESERSGDQVERLLLHSLLRMFHDLGMYVDLFEAPFLKATREYYASEASTQLQALDVPSYLHHVRQRLAQEEQRVVHYLHLSTRKALLACTLEQTLAAHTDAIVEKGFSALMDQTRLDDLKNMYGLYGLVDALPKLKAAFAAYIKRVGTAMVGDAEQEKSLVAELLLFKERLDKVLTASFSSNESFMHSLKEAFETFINGRQNRAAELVARFIDTKLRSGNKGTSDEELEEVLDKTMTLFRYIDGKDMFEAFYKKDLSKRLLLDKSASQVHAHACTPLPSHHPPSPTHTSILTPPTTTLRLLPFPLSGRREGDDLQAQGRMRQRLHLQARGHVQGCRALARRYGVVPRVVARAVDAERGRVIRSRADARVLADVSACRGQPAARSADLAEHVQHLLPEQAQRPAAAVAPLLRPLHAKSLLPSRAEGAHRQLAPGHRLTALQRPGAHTLFGHPLRDGDGRQGAESDITGKQQQAASLTSLHSVLILPPSTSPTVVGVRQDEGAAQGAKGEGRR